jgi:hypothetical protein
MNGTKTVNGTTVEHYSETFAMATVEKNSPWFRG